jgi:hypothetical protein
MDIFCCIFKKFIDLNNYLVGIIQLVYKLPDDIFYFSEEIDLIQFRILVL